MVYEYENEPVIRANQHSHLFTGLTPGEKYIYRVGNDELLERMVRISNSHERG